MSCCILYSSLQCRITFKEETGEMVIATATYTQRLPYASVKKIEATPIEGQVSKLKL
jgi:hypothetical protein